MPLTIDNLKAFWEQARKFRYLFDKHVNGDFKKFCELFLYEGPNNELQSRGLFWRVDDLVGVFYMDHIKPAVSAEVHYSFFDQRSDGRQKLARDMLRYVFAKYNFKRLYAEIPLYSRPATFVFAESIGFRRVGRLRKATFHNEEWFDVAVFDILKGYRWISRCWRLNQQHHGNPLGSLLRWWWSSWGKPRQYLLQASRARCERPTL
jgi:RimJ/RimL family protein N-acetyltransferase